jgi:glycosyltransferase involved in cell wall biosynthesis
VRILGLAGDDSGSGFYRVQLPLAMLADHGHQVRGLTQTPGPIPWARLRVGPGPDASPLGSGVVDVEVETSSGMVATFQLDAKARAKLPPIPDEPVDLAVGQRIVRRDLLATWRRLGTVTRLVLDLDDDLFRVSPDNRRAYGIYSVPQVQTTLREAVALSDLVTVSTEPLARAVLDECQIDPARVAVLPNRVAPSLLAVDRPRRDRVTIGWAGSPSHEPDMALVAVPLRKFLDRHRDVDLHLIGHDWRSAMGLRRSNVRVTGWAESLPAYWRSIDFDIGLAPLAHSIFAMSKSAIKVLEYGALGIPSVASDEAPYRDAIVDGVTGFLVRRPADWERRLRELVCDAAMRAEMGAAAKSHIAANHSMSTGWQDWERAYLALCGAQTAAAPRTTPGRTVTTRRVPVPVRAFQRQKVG